jgi:hypothetical protein
MLVKSVWFTFDTVVCTSPTDNRVRGEHEVRPLSPTPQPLSNRQVAQRCRRDRERVCDDSVRYRSVFFTFDSYLQLPSHCRIDRLCGSHILSFLIRHTAVYLLPGYAMLNRFLPFRSDQWMLFANIVGRCIGHLNV